MKIKYKLHWASSNSPDPKLKWVIYNWHLKCPVAYAETRSIGRLLCDYLNEIDR